MAYGTVPRSAARQLALVVLALFFAGNQAGAIEIQWRSWNPRVVAVGTTVTAELTISTDSDPASPEVVITTNGCVPTATEIARVPLLPVWPHTYQATFAVGLLLHNYHAGDNHAVVGCLRTSGAPSINVIVNVRSGNAPDVPIQQLAPDAQKSAHILNLRDDDLLLGEHPTVDHLIRFYDYLDDEYDFIAVLDQVDTTTNRSYFARRNHVEGIGRAILDQLPGDIPSRLKGTIIFPIDSLFDGASKTLSHEWAHSVMMFLVNPSLASGSPHWPISDLAYGITGFNIPGSGVGGTFPFAIVDRGDGTYSLESVPVAGEFNDLELYLLGLVGPEDVGDHIVFLNQDQGDQLFPGGVLEGPIEVVTIEDVIAANGARLPPAGEAQAAFRMATVVLSSGGLLSPSEMAFFDHMAARGESTVELPITEGLSRGITKPFFLATGGRATLSTMIVDPTTNDACVTPSPVSGCNISVPFDNRSATTDGLDHASQCGPEEGGNVYNDVWFCWEPPSDAAATISVCEQTTLDTKLSVYGPFPNCASAISSCPPGDAELLRCNNDACGLQSRVDFLASGESVYLVRLGSEADAVSGSGTLEITCQVQTEVCESGDPQGVCQLPSMAADIGARPSGVEEYQAADDFVPTVDANVTRVTWWGGYEGVAPGPLGDCGIGALGLFTMTYYLDAGGLPGPTLAGPFPITNVSKCATGGRFQVESSSLDEYRFEAVHPPVRADGGARYWVQIAGDTGDETCRWVWRTSESGDVRAAIGSGDAFDPVTLDFAFCYNTIRQTCRSAGYYMTHSDAASGATTNVTSELIAAAGCIEVCGEVLSGMKLDSADSVLEALCVDTRGVAERQASRQLVTLGLNCVASGYGPTCRGWPGVEELFHECNQICEDGTRGSTWTLDSCTSAVACVNEGGDPFSAPGTCLTGVCSDNGAACSTRDRSRCGSPIEAACEMNTDSCHSQELCNPGIGVCVPPGTKPSPKACKRARSSACTILDVGQTTEHDCASGVRADVETCCHDVAECNDSETCTADTCVIGPGCTNAPIPGCCKDDTECVAPRSTCDPLSNRCVECVDTEDCDDGDGCTLDQCDGATCTRISIPGCCRSDADCEDPNAPRCLPNGQCGPAEFCGDGILQLELGEECDDASEPPEICCDCRFYVPTLCEQNCRCDPTLGRVCESPPGCCVTNADCPEPTAPVCLPSQVCGVLESCGDGIVQPELGEECEDVLGEHDGCCNCYLYDAHIDVQVSCTGHENDLVDVGDYPSRVLDGCVGWTPEFGDTLLYRFCATNTSSVGQLDCRFDAPSLGGDVLPPVTVSAGATECVDVSHFGCGPGGPGGSEVEGITEGILVCEAICVDEAPGEPARVAQVRDSDLVAVECQDPRLRVTVDCIPMTAEPDTLRDLVVRLENIGSATLQNCVVQSDTTSPGACPASEGGPLVLQGTVTRLDPDGEASVAFVDQVIQTDGSAACGTALVTCEVLDPTGGCVLDLDTQQCKTIEAQGNALCVEVRAG